MPNITIDAQKALEMMQLMTEAVQKSATVDNASDGTVSPLALYLLQKAGYEDIMDKNGVPISKSDIDATTLDFTRGRTLSEAEAEIQLNFILDKSPYLRMFNSRIVNKLVVPIEAKSITKKNLISNEQNGGAVSVINKRIVHNFGINLYLKHAQLQKDIPLQAVINNLYKPGWEASVIADIATALSNDVLLLCMNGTGGDYASTENFYDLNMGFVKILQQANGKNTNTYGSIQVNGFLAKHLTPHKVSSLGTTGTNYTAANLLSLLRKMYKRMPAQYRKDPNNVFMMSQQDLDLYVDSRSDMSAPSNVTREQVLTDGNTPRFMGYQLIAVPDMLSINEKHENASTMWGAIIFGNPKNIDIATDKTSYLKSMAFNSRGSLGPVYEYTYDMYLDVQVAKLDSFVVAFNVGSTVGTGAVVETPYFVTSDGAKSGSAGKMTEYTGNTYNAAENGGADGDNLTVVPYCDTLGAVMVACSTTLAGAADYATAINVSTAAILPEGTAIELSADTYVRAYHSDLTVSTQILFNKTK